MAEYNTHHRFIGWLKNFITDRNNATQNLIDSYTAATLVRRAPLDIRAALHAHWLSTNRPSSSKSFLHTAERILKRSKGRAGLHEVAVKLATYNCRRVREPSVALRLWFDSIEPGLLIHELNKRATVRKNGYPVKERSHVSYYCNGELCIGQVISIFVGSRISAPFIVGAAVCVVRKLDASRLTPVESSGRANVYTVDLFGPASSLELVCCKRLRHKYFRTVWDVTPDQHFALVRFDEY